MVVVQLATPESESVPLNPTSTAWLYQPSSSGSRFACPPVAVGAVVSYWIWNVRRVRLPARSVQLPLKDPVAD